MRENVFQEQVRKILNDREIWHLVYWGGGRFTKQGVPDILACIDGQMHGIELKTDTGVESKLQAYNLDGINHSGGMGYLLRPTKYKKLKFDDEFDYFQLTLEEWMDEFIERG